MATLDLLNRFSNAQNLTATGVSTNKIDFTEDRNIGIGEPMAVVVFFVADTEAGTDETYTLDVRTDATDAMSSPRIIASRSYTTAQALAEMQAGSKAVLPIPPDTLSEVVVDVNYTMAGTAPDITVTTVLLPISFIENWVPYPDGFDIQ